MKIEIKSRFDSTVLFTAEAASLLLALETAVESRADLSGANLRGANLYGADLPGANLRSADLSGANLRSADLSVANLRCASLSGASLTGANLRSADLSVANLRGASLTGANLRSADLSVANLRGASLSANLRGANLYGADLSGANLRSADLSGANLYGADLSGANLRSADLSVANLRAASLSGASLSGAKNLSPLLQAQTSILPAGNLVGWKICKDNVIVKLLIPQKALRSNATGRKCRANYVEVLNVYGAVKGYSQHDGTTEYIKGAIVKCDNWNPDRWTECGGGIHFFLTREEAEAYE